MQSIAADHERRRHEAETKACIALRKAQDSEIRFNISDKRRKDADKKTKELEMQIKDAISLALQSEVVDTEAKAEEAIRFDRIRGVFDNQAFEESKKRVDAEHRAHEVMKKRAEAEAKCLEETERRVQAEVRVKHEMRIRIDEEMRNKALRSKLKDTEEKLKLFEVQTNVSLNCEKRKKAEDSLKTMLRQAQQSLSLADQKRREAEAKGLKLEQQISSAEARALDFERSLEDRNNRVAELKMLLEQTRADFKIKLEYGLTQLEHSSRKLEESDKKVEELHMVLDSIAVPPESKISKMNISLCNSPDYAIVLQALAAQQVNYVKLEKLQTTNADLEVIIRELKEKVQRNEDSSKVFNLLTLKAQFEETVVELKQKLEQEDHTKVQLQATVEELKDTVREQTQKSFRLITFESSAEYRRLGDSLNALRVEENPLFRPEPLNDDLLRNFLSRPDSVTDDSQMSPRERPESVTGKPQQVLFSSAAMGRSDSEANLMESPKSGTEDGDVCLYHKELCRLQKQSLLKKLSQNEALIKELTGSVQEGHKKHSELEFELKVALQSREAAEIKADAFMSQLELAVQREKEKDKEYLELSGNTSFRGKKEKRGILDRFRSKVKLANA